MVTAEPTPESVSRPVPRPPRTVAAARGRGGAGSSEALPAAAVRRALAALASREIRELAASVRFRVTAALTLALLVVSAWAGASRYLAETGEHRRLSEEVAGVVDGLPLDDLLREPYPIFKPPWKLAVLSDGRQRWTPDVYRATLSVWTYPQLTRLREAGPELAREPLDWVFVIRVILSMAAFALGYDAVCGKRQRAILDLVLSYPVSRWQAVSAKLLAVWVCVAAPFVLGAAASLLILAARGIDFTAGELAKGGLLVLAGLWASAIFAALAILVSLRARESARSLAVLVLLWVTAVIAIPGAGSLLARTALPLQTDQEIARSILAVRQEVEAEHGGPGSLRDPADAVEDGYATEKETAAIQNQRYRLQERERRRRVLEELAQAELAQDVASISPMFLVQDLAERLLGSGLLRDRSFVAQAWDYGDRLAARTVELDGLDPGSPRLWESLELRDPRGLHVRLLPRFASGRAIASSDLPRFVFRERSLGEGLRAAAPRAGILGLLSVALLISLRASAASFAAGRRG